LDAAYRALCDPAAILGIDNLNSFRVQLSQWSHQGHFNKIGPALYGPALKHP
jgi:hypothetical protein